MGVIDVVDMVSKPRPCCKTAGKVEEKPVDILLNGESKQDVSKKDLEQDKKDSDLSTLKDVAFNIFFYPCFMRLVSFWTASYISLFSSMSFFIFSTEWMVVE